MKMCTQVVNKCKCTCPVSHFDSHCADTGKCKQKFSTSTYLKILAWITSYLMDPLLSGGRILGERVERQLGSVSRITGALWHAAMIMSAADSRIATCHVDIHAAAGDPQGSL